MLNEKSIAESGLQICSRCIYDERVNGIQFDEDGVCNFCHQVDTLKEQFGTGTAVGRAKLERYGEAVLELLRGA